MNFRITLATGLFLLSLMGSTSIHAQDSIKETDQLDFAEGLLSRGMYDMAILQYQKFITDYPHSPNLQQAYLALGEGYFLSQDFKNAVDTFNQFKQLFPSSDQMPVSLLRLAQIDIQQQKYDDAIKELTSIDAQKQLKGSLLQSFDYYTAQAYAGKSDTTNALDYYQKASAVDGADEYTAYALEETGKIDVQQSKPADALAQYAKALPLAHDDTLKGELTYRVAEAQYLSGNYADAIKGFQQVIDQYSSLGFNQNALANMLLAYFNLGQYDQLLSVYQKDAKDIKDDDTYFSTHFAAVLANIELKQYDQANAILDHVLTFPTLKPEEKTKVYVKKADILIKEKKYKDALALLDANASGITDDAGESLFLKGQAYFGLGDFDHAFTFFENLNLNFPSSRFSQAALLGQAHSRQKMGRFKEAEALFLKYYNSQDNPALKSDALFDGILTAVKAGDSGAVISNAQEYLKAFPTSSQYIDVLLILADNYNKNNQHKEAAQLLQGYLTKNPTTPRPNSVNFLLGYNQQMAGNNDQALASYAQVDGQKEEGKYYPDALKNSAIIYLNEKKEDQALVFFDKLISLPGQNDLQVSTYVWVCNTYLKGQKYDDVLRVAALAEKHFSPQDLQEIEYFKAEALRGLGRCDDAQKGYATIIASATKNIYTGSAHIGDGLCMEKAAQYDAAAQEFQKALNENSDDYTITAHARFELANVDAAQGKTDDALKLYLLVATIYDDSYYCSQSLLQSAKIFEKMNRKPDAVKMYSEILDKYKDSAAATEAKTNLANLK